MTRARRPIRIARSMRWLSLVAVAHLVALSAHRARHHVVLAHQRVEQQAIPLGLRRALGLDDGLRHLDRLGILPAREHEQQTNHAGNSSR